MPKKYQQKRHRSRIHARILWVDSQHNVTLVLDLYQLHMYTNVKHIVLRQSPKRPDIFFRSKNSESQNKFIQIYPSSETKPAMFACAKPWVYLRCFFTLYHRKSPSNHHLGKYLFTLSTHKMKIFGESTSLTAAMLIRSDFYRTNRSSYLGLEPLLKTKAVKGRQVAWLFFV